MCSKEVTSQLTRPRAGDLVILAFDRLASDAALRLRIGTRPVRVAAQPPWRATTTRAEAAAEWLGAQPTALTQEISASQRRTVFELSDWHRPRIHGCTSP
jgi:hypothetical protein